MITFMFDSGLPQLIQNSDFLLLKYAECFHILPKIIEMSGMLSFAALSPNLNNKKFI